VYIGDNPLDDFLAPNNLGMITIRIFNSDFKNIKIKKQNDAQIKIKKISEIKKIFSI
jgi:FMN phosphatase YigB (HAD superfamily)